MNKLFHRTARSWLLMLLACACGAVHAGPVLADWDFADAPATSLNNTVNSGAGIAGAPTAWSVAVTGVATTGGGVLAVGNDGKGGSGTRSAYADFGPDFDQVSTGMISLFTRFSAWHPAAAGMAQSFSLALIEGNDFATAGFRFDASATGFTLTGEADGIAAALSPSATFGVFLPLTVRLDLDLDAMRYALGYDSGAGFVALGSASIDAFTAGVNSLRLGVAGDYRANSLLVDRIWVEQGAVAASVPEPGTVALMLAGLFLLACTAHRRNNVLRTTTTAVLHPREMA